MQETRGKILHYLGEHPRSSAPKIARYLEMTPANIRYHLEILISEGLVQVSGKRSPGGAGRPILLYHLTPAVLGSSYQALLGYALEWIQGSGNSKGIIHQIAAQFAGKFSPREGNRVQRFNQAVDFLNQHSYGASWEARPEGPRVSLRHCPYQDLARSQALICRLDEELLSSLFKTEMELIEKRNFENDPFSPCIFHPRS